MNLSYGGETAFIVTPYVTASLGAFLTNGQL